MYPIHTTPLCIVTNTLYTFSYEVSTNHKSPRVAEGALTIGPGPGIYSEISDISLVGAVQADCICTVYRCVLQRAEVQA